MVDIGFCNAENTVCMGANCHGFSRWVFKEIKLLCGLFRLGSNINQPKNIFNGIISDEII